MDIQVGDSSAGGRCVCNLGRADYFIFEARRLGGATCGGSPSLLAHAPSNPAHSQAAGDHALHGHGTGEPAKQPSDRNEGRILSIDVIRKRRGRAMGMKARSPAGTVEVGPRRGAADTIAFDDGMKAVFLKRSAVLCASRRVAPVSRPTSPGCACWGQTCRSGRCVLETTTQCRSSLPCTWAPSAKLSRIRPWRSRRGSSRAYDERRVASVTAYLAMLADELR